VLKQERHARILEILGAEGRVVASELEEALAVSGYTIRRDLDELADDGRLQRVHGGALARSPVARSYEGRQRQEISGKIAVARAAAALLHPGQVVVLDGGSTALQVVDALPPGHTGTFITHSPPVAAALGRHDGLEVVMVGGTLDPRAMVTVGARTVAAYREVTADVCLLGVWSVHPTAGLSTGYAEEAEVRRVLVHCADRVVGLASRDKLGTRAPFGFGPATALTHLATEPDVPDDVLAPYEELGIVVVRDGAARPSAAG
jgi:DeoR/GlpR family transcriptional regulator of sugar metabolism